MKTKILLTLISLFSLVMFVPSQTQAAIRIGNEHIIVNEDEIVDDDLYAAGEAVTIKGVVNGDVYAAAGIINVSGQINGDLISAGGSITISNSQIDDDVRVAGGNVIISGTDIGDSLSIFGGNTSVTGGTIDGGLNFASGTTLIDSLVGRGIVGGSGIVNLDSQVGRDAFIGAGTFTLGPNAVINGDLNYSAEEEGSIDPGAQVAGNLNFQQYEVNKDKPNKEMAAQAVKSAFVGFKVWAFLASLASGAVLLWLFPKAAQQLAKHVSTAPMQTLGWGLLKMLLIIPAIILLLVTVVGIPLAGIVLFVFIVDVILAKYVVSLSLGQFINKKLKLNQTNQYLIYALGLAVYSVFIFPPIIGNIIGLLGFLLGLGALAQYTKKQVMDQRK